MGPDRFRAEKKMVNCSLAVPLFLLEVCEHFLCNLIFWISLQYPFEQRDGELILGLIEELHLTLQSYRVVRRETQRLLKGINRILVAALD